MRAIHIDDVHLLARFAALNNRMACYDVLVRAHVADKYRKKFDRAHPKFGMGSISSTLFHMAEPLTGLTWLNASETRTSFERTIGVIAELKSDLHHRDWQKRAL
jgi:hypothetical protein